MANQANDRVVVGTFNDYITAQQASRELENQGISSSSIRVQSMCPDKGSAWHLPKTSYKEVLRIFHQRRCAFALASKVRVVHTTGRWPANSSGHRSWASAHSAPPLPSKERREVRLFAEIDEFPSGLSVTRPEQLDPSKSRTDLICKPSPATAICLRCFLFALDSVGCQLSGFGFVVSAAGSCDGDWNSR